MQGIARVRKRILARAVTRYEIIKWRVLTVQGSTQARSEISATAEQEVSVALKEKAVKELLASMGKILESSWSRLEDGYIALMAVDGAWQLAVALPVGSELIPVFKGGMVTEREEVALLQAPLNSNNLAVVRHAVAHARPSACGTKGVSVVLPDPLGLETTVLADLCAGKQLKPVLAETSPAGSAALGRNLLHASDAATAVALAAGKKSGYGTSAVDLQDDGDMVKGLLYGFTSLGLDGAPKLNLDVQALPDEVVHQQYMQLKEEFRAALETTYLKAEFKVGRYTIKYTAPELERIVLLYGMLIMQVQDLYTNYLADTPYDIDFELDLAAAGAYFTPQAHYLLAKELGNNKVKLSTLNLSLLGARGVWGLDLSAHAAIATEGGYRLSLADADVALAEPELAELGYDTPAGLVKACGGKVQLKYNNLAYVATLRTLETCDPALYAEVLQGAGLTPQKLSLPPAAEALTHMTQVVLAQEKVLGGEHFARVREVVSAHLDVYEAAVRELATPLFRGL